MKTWNDYKEHVKTVDPEGKADIEEAENLAKNFSTTWTETHCICIKTDWSVNRGCNPTAVSGTVQSCSLLK